MGVGEKLKRCRKVLLLRVWGEPGSKTSEQSGKHAAQQTLGPLDLLQPPPTLPCGCFAACEIGSSRLAARAAGEPCGWEALAQQQQWPSVAPC